MEKIKVVLRTIGLVISAGILGSLIWGLIFVPIEIAVEYSKTNGLFELSLFLDAIQKMNGLVFFGSWIWLSGIFLKHSMLKKTGFSFLIIFLIIAIVPYALSSIIYEAAPNLSATIPRK